MKKSQVSIKKFMNKPQLKTVYIPELESNEYGVFFTAEEYNIHIKEVIENTLETAANKAQIIDIGEIGRDGDYYPYVIIDKKSITNTLEQTFEQWKIYI